MFFVLYSQKRILSNVIMTPAETIDTLRREAEQLESKLSELEGSLHGLDHLKHGPQFLREQLRAAAAFRSAGKTRCEEICYFKAALAFDLLETQVLICK